MHNRAVIHPASVFMVFAVILILANSVFGQADLSMSVVVQPSFGVDANGNQTYFATVTNVGGSDATNLTVAFTLPADDIPISGSPDGACTFAPGSSSVIATCSLGTLILGAQTQTNVVVHPTVVGQKDVTVLATESGGGRTTTFASSEITEVAISDMQVTLADGSDPAKVGQPLVYTVTGLNIGDDSASQVSLTVTLPAGVQFVSATTGCTRTGTLVICKAGSLSPSQSKSFQIMVTPTRSGWLYATAGVRLSSPDPSTANNSSAARTWVNP